VFARLGTWCHRRRRRVVAAWLVALVVLGGIAGAVGADFREELNIPDGEGATGFDILNEEFNGVGAGLSGSIVFRAGQGVADPEVRTAMEAMFAELDARDDMSITSPYEAGNEFQVAFLGDDAGKIAFAQVEMPEDTTWSASGAAGKTMRQLAPVIDGLQVEIGGEPFAEFKEPKSEIIGLSFAIVILIVSFGSVLAMGLPVGVALGGISVGTTLLLLSTQVFAVPDFAQFLGIMIGLGVGIDYALFIVTRYRENLHHGHDSEEATALALDTAGRAVAFAGTTVVVSFLGMLVIGMAFVSGLAVAAALVVATTVVASLTLLPALLGFAQHRVEVTRWRGLIAAGGVSLALLGVGLEIQPFLVGLPIALVVLVAGFAVAPLRREVPHREPTPVVRTFAYRWSRWIQHHPWKAALIGSGFLLVLAVPVLGLRLGFSDEGNYAPETTTRKAYDLLADGFGPGFNGPFVMAARLDPGTDLAALGAVTEAVMADPGVAFASPAVPNDVDAPTAALWRVIPATAPQDEATTNTVKRLREEVLPPIEAQVGTDVNLTGFTAVAVDFAEYLGARTPYFFGAVLILSFLLLMAVFRSVLVPLKAVVMNLLSIGAAYGVVVALFQWGWLSDLTGVQPAPIEPFIPMMLFAIVFGLSMDYEVFLLSRIKEEWTRTHDSHLSVANGLAVTAKVITAAAAIMVVVFGSFLFEPDRIFKLFGTGLAVAILLDATVVRMLLVPATMELLGDRNWWLPRWLDRLLPNIDVEGHGDGVVDAALDQDGYADDVDVDDDGGDPDLEPELAPA
jgi:putative drug exporter of the RND superfamily